MIFVQRHYAYCCDIVQFLIPILSEYSPNDTLKNVCYLNTQNCHVVEVAYLIRIHKQKQIHGFQFVS